MLRSLYSAVSGLKTHQTRMDVIGNNIANVNTEAFKSSSVRFSEIMYQTTSSASSGNGASGIGGVNAKQELHLLVSQMVELQKLQVFRLTLGFRIKTPQVFLWLVMVQTDILQEPEIFM